MDIIGAFQKLLTTASRIIHQKLRTGPIWGIRKNLITVGREPPDPSGESLFFRRWWRRSGPNLAATWRKRMPPPSWASRRGQGGGCNRLSKRCLSVSGLEDKDNNNDNNSRSRNPLMCKGKIQTFPFISIAKVMYLESTVHLRLPKIWCQPWRI